MAISATQVAGYSSGQPTTTQTTTNNQPTVVQTSGVSSNPQTFLYDVGLQNIYQDYQRGMQTLNTREQQSLQDAYYIREMSKKYLGEYASNVGMGDVSGNLLDIYGQYQQSVQQTREQFSEKELELQQTYDTARRQLETGKLVAELTPAEGGVDVVDYSNRFLPNGQPNPDYIENFNPQDFYPNDPEVGSNSRVISIGGVEYVSVNLPAGQEGEDSNFTVSSEDINEWYAEKFNDNESPYYQKAAGAGAVVFYEGNQSYYRKGEDGQWYRLKTGSGVSESRNLSQKNNLFYLPSGETKTTINLGGVQFNIEVPNNPGRTDINIRDVKVTSGQNEYRIPVSTADGVLGIQQGTYFLPNNTQSLTTEQRRVLDLFHQSHNTSRTQRGKDQKNAADLRKNSFVVYNGKVYMFIEGKIVQMQRRAG
jgi:hypothetical protein